MTLHVASRTDYLILMKFFTFRSRTLNLQYFQVSVFERLADRVLDECHDTFTACFHAFYPTGNLKWTCLCELLMLVEPVSAGENADVDEAVFLF